MGNESGRKGCPFLAGCPFFNENMRAYPVGAEVMKDQYCRGDYARCARYIIATQLGREKMPSMLFPNQMDRAQKVLAEQSGSAACGDGFDGQSCCFIPKDRE